MGVRFRLRGAVWVAVFLLLAIIVRAQESRFKSQTNLVLVPVTVHNSHGEHVSGLAKNQFLLWQDGKGVAIDSFEEVRTVREAIVPVPDERAVFTNRVVASTAPRALTVIAIDTINSSVLQQTSAKLQLLDFVKHLVTMGQPTALVSLEVGRVRVLYDFSTDRNAVLDAIAKLETRQNSGLENFSTLDNQQAIAMQVANAPESPATFGEMRAWVYAKVAENKLQRFEQARVRRETLAALRMLAAALQGFPGRKNLIWVSSGLPFSEGVLKLNAFGGAEPSTVPVTPPLGPSREVASGQGNSNRDYVNSGGGQPAGLLLSHELPDSEGLEDQEQTARAFNDANVAVYPIDARGIVNTSFDNISGEHKYSSQAMDREMAYRKAQETINTFEAISSTTGGKPCYGRAMMEKCFAEVADDSASYYMLGFYVKGNTKPGWHKLKVEATKGMKTRSRTGFTFEGGPALLNAGLQEAMASLMMVPIEQRGIVISGKYMGAVAASSKKASGFDFTLGTESIVIDKEHGNHVDFDILGVAYDEAGKISGQTSKKFDLHLGAESLAQVTANGMRFQSKLALAAGEYKVRFIVRDNQSGKVGSVTTRVKVE